MCKPAHFVLVLLITLTVPLSSAATDLENPRVAVIMSRASFERQWDVTQMSGHGWVGIVNLAGIPYDTLFLEDLVSGQSLSSYKVLVFAECTTMEPEIAQQLAGVLAGYLTQHGNILVDGALGAYTKDGKPQVPAALWSLLGISHQGVHGDASFRIQVYDNHHFITRSFEASQYLSQMLARGLEIEQFSSGGNVLATSTDGRSSFPFLSYRQTGSNRLVLLSDATTFAGATSIFRNESPQGFFANQVVNILIRALQWAAYGDLSGAFPAPQFSNADLAVLVRLDADNTQNLDFQKQTFQFLFDTARQTGVVPLYCFVSSAGAQAGWKDLAELGQRLEDLGGEIGSHSKYHRIESRMGPEKYKEELDGSIEEIESNMSSNGAHIGEVNLFINPGDTIVNSDYEEIARRFQLMMTHGFEQDTPIGFGVMTWFAGSHKDFVVLDDTPSPDYQWFYDPTWSYTTAQITSYQEAIFDHLFHNIGRGYIYNQMWHDYSISSMPLRHASQDGQTGGGVQPGRIANTSNVAMYEALRSKFGTYRIYTPQPIEVVEKLRALAGWRYSWMRRGNSLEMVLDLSDLPRNTTAAFVGGMGIRIENTASRIQSVFINGQAHDAFSDRMIVLPNLTAGRNELKLVLSEAGAGFPHITYVSARMPSVRRTANGMEFQLLTKSKGSFAIHSPGSGIVLHADSQAFNLRGDHVLTGVVNSDRTLEYVALQQNNFSSFSTTVPVRAAKEGSDTLTLLLDKPGAEKPQVAFSAARSPKRIRFSGQAIHAVASGSEYLLALPEYKKEPASLEILW